METLANMGVTVTPVVTLTQVLTVLSSHGKISEDKVKEVQEFVLNNQTVKKKEEVKEEKKDESEEEEESDDMGFNMFA